MIVLAEGGILAAGVQLEIIYQGEADYRLIMPQPYCSITSPSHNLINEPRWRLKYFTSEFFTSQPLMTLI